MRHLADATNTASTTSPLIGVHPPGHAIRNVEDIPGSRAHSSIEVIMIHDAAIVLARRLVDVTVLVHGLDEPRSCGRSLDTVDDHLSYACALLVVGSGVADERTACVGLHDARIQDAVLGRWGR